ncbi:hypothetical protein ACIQYG_13535 [Peribacillus sp. NPDC096622]|uniref:hypothetical protein n=1 Tax=Peribacillus sp. NPDC096622 TaxID=3364396 RepID=UPI003803D9CD
MINTKPAHMRGYICSLQLTFYNRQNVGPISHSDVSGLVTIGTFAVLGALAIVSALLYFIMFSLHEKKQRGTSTIY